MRHRTATLPSHAVGRDRQLVSGLRWTLWLSVLTAPCGYVTSILLARVGPAAIGEYGLLSLYVAITSVFLFLGGPAVAIRFIPLVQRRDANRFFWSYLIVALLAALPFQVAAAIWPAGLRFVFGEIGTWRFHVLLVFLADIYILFHLVIAGLKGLLELKLAQVLLRAVTVASFLVYAAVYVSMPGLISAHFHLVIWCTYIGITVVITVVALRRFLTLVPPQENRFRLILPDGFWRYTLGLQASSVLGFLSTKLDYLLVLNAGGIATLGRYVALMTLVSLVPMFATFVLDSYLPSLTTLLSAGDVAAAERVTRRYVRLICLSGAGAISFMSIFAGPLVQMLGPHYSELTAVLRIALPFAGVQIGNWIIGTIFSGAGLPQRDAFAKAVRTILFVAAFQPFWQSAHFLGAVWIWGIAETSYQLLGLGLLHGKLRFRLHLFGAYLPMLAVAVSLTYVTRLFDAYGTPAGVAGWLVSMVIFLALARYSQEELAGLWRTVVPGCGTADAEVFAVGAGASTAA